MVEAILDLQIEGYFGICVPAPKLGIEFASHEILVPPADDAGVQTGRLRSEIRGTRISTENAYPEMVNLHLQIRSPSN